MEHCLAENPLPSLMFLLTACVFIPKHTEIPTQTATETAKPAAPNPTPTPATAYEVTLQRATTWVSGTGSMVSEYPNVLAPSETGYLYENTLLDELVHGELTLLARPDVVRAKVDLVCFAATDIDFTMDKYGDLRIKVRVQNTSDEIYIQTKIVALLFDADGNLLGMDYTYLDEDLAPGQKVGFELSVMELPESLLEQVADCRVWAYPVQYNW